MVGKPKINLSEFMKLYKQGYLDKDIAKILGISKSTVKYWRKRLGLGRSNYFKRKTRKVNLKDLIKLLKQGYSYNYIAKRLGIHSQTVYLWAKKLNMQHSDYHSKLKHIWEERKKILKEALKRKIMITYKEARRILNVDNNKLRQLLRLYPNEFTTYKFTFFSTTFTSGILNGLLYNRAGKFIALKNDERIVDYIAKKLPKPISRGQLLSIYSNLKNAVGKEMARKIIDKLLS